MILEIDVGNSALKWRVIGIQAGGGSAGRLLLPNASMLGEVAAKYPLVKIVRVSCVASAQVKETLAQDVVKLWGVEPQFAHSQKNFSGLTLIYEDPSRLGVDRWLAMLAAMRKTAGSVCVIDCGSAITIDLVEEGGLHRGGYIVPGLAMQRTALRKNTAQIRVEEVIANQNIRWGSSTEEAINYGLFRMVVAFVDAVVDELIELKVMPTLFLTGGDAALLLPMFKRPYLFEGCPDLVLDGLQVALP